MAKKEKKKESEEETAAEAAARKVSKAVKREEAVDIAPSKVVSGKETKMKSAKRKAAEDAKPDRSEAALDVSGDRKTKKGKKASGTKEVFTKAPKEQKKLGKEKKLGKKDRQPESGAKSGMAAESEALESENEVAKKPAKERIPCTCFVGQLPYQASANDIEEHFKSAGAAPSYVRLLTNKQGGGSRGMAFVEFSNESDVHTALRLHHSSMYGRRINVERTVGGGSAMPKRQEKLKDLRERQGAQMQRATREMVARILPADAAAAAAAAAAAKAKEGDADDGGDAPLGGATQEDVDDRVLTFLTTVAPGVAEAALQECASLDFKGVRNRSAYLMGVLRRMTTESDRFAHKAGDTAAKPAHGRKGVASAKAGKLSAPLKRKAGHEGKEEEPRKKQAKGREDATKQPKTG